MTRFLIRRIVMGLITLWVIITLVFVLYYARPGVDPARELAGRAVTPALLANINKEYGFNLPVIVQYWNYLKRLVPIPGQFNLGISNTNRLPVTTIIAQAVPIDISLAVGSAIIWMILGISVGVLAARRPRSLWDRGATVFVLTGVSMPTFILGLLLLYVFYYLLTIHGVAIFPKPGSWIPFTQNPLEWAHDLILPWITLALITAATYSRLTRSTLLETLGEDYIRTARAKGLSERRVVYRHALRRLAHAHPHAVRHRPRHRARRRDHHREHLRPARPRARGGPGDPGAESPRRHRNRARCLLLRGGGEHRRRRALRRPRSTRTSVVATGAGEATPAGIKHCLRGPRSHAAGRVASHSIADGMTTRYPTTRVLGERFAVWTSAVTRSRA